MLDRYTFAFTLPIIEPPPIQIPMTEKREVDKDVWNPWEPIDNSPQTIVISKDSLEKAIFTGKGDDNVTIMTGGVIGDVWLSEGNNTLTVAEGASTNAVGGGSGNDNFNLNGMIAGDVFMGTGDNTIQLGASADIQGDIIAEGSGNNVLRLAKDAWTVTNDLGDGSRYIQRIGDTTNRKIYAYGFGTVQFV